MLTSAKKPKGGKRDNAWEFYRSLTVKRYSHYDDVIYRTKDTEKVSIIDIDTLCLNQSDIDIEIIQKAKQL